MIILCHKCSGVLASNESDSGLRGCRCISGYVRGFEESLSRESAILEQMQSASDMIRLYIDQNRPIEFCEGEIRAICRLYELSES